MENVTEIEFHWGLMIVNYLFLAGISAGAFATSSLATYLGSKRYENLARLGAFLAPFPVAIGTGLLILDLGNPLNFWRLFVTVEFTSPMSIGAWFLTGFLLLSVVYAYLWLPDWWRNLVRFPRRRSELNFPETWQPLDIRTVYQGRRLLAALGFPLSLGVGIYTGILLGAIPARPFWNTPMTAQLFLFSAMSTGAASLLLITALLPKRFAPPDVASERRLLNSLDVVFIVLEILMIIPFILHHALSTWSSASSVSLIMGGPFTLLFWVGVVLLGILTPLAIETFELFPVVLEEAAERYSRWMALASGLLVLTGGFLLRYVFVHAGQVSQFLGI